jgi:hypothetical protein
MRVLVSAVSCIQIKAQLPYFLPLLRASSSVGWMMDDGFTIEPIGNTLAPYLSSGSRARGLVAVSNCL